MMLITTSNSTIVNALRRDEITRFDIFERNRGGESAGAADV
jgi:hypothetical protein